MKKYLFAFSALFLLISVGFLSCSKPGSNNTSNTSPVNFTWSYNGNNYTATMAEAYTNGSGPWVIAAVIGPNFFTFERRVDFDLTSFNTGTYQFQSPNTNLIRYMNEPSLPAGSVNTTINITSNSGNLLSGNFSGLMNDNSSVNKPISGTFTNVPIIR
jgi:hypothetical protein